MITSAIKHHSFYPFVQSLARTHVRLILETAQDDISVCKIIWWKRTNPLEQHCVPMEIRLENDHITQWEADLNFKEEVHYIKYGFLLTDKTGKQSWFNTYGIHKEFIPQGSFEILQVNETDLISIPEWSKGCIYYQIFPERFDRYGSTNKQLEPWNSIPTRENFLGGNLKGIIKRLSYLSELNIDCIYLNPIFLGDFNHKYATTDYFKIDPIFGTEVDLIELVDKAHKLGIRFILDGVFNHSGIHFAPFMNLIKNGKNSKYIDWFFPKQYPIQIHPAYYECVGDYPYMPRLNGANTEVREYVLDVLLYWLKYANIDGWRFDVADELDRHAVTWWREEIKRLYPDAIMLCETWGDASYLLGPDGFDSAMNYLFRDAMIDYFAKDKISASQLNNRLNSMLMKYPDEINLTMYNCLGSHDTARFLTEAKGEKWRLRLAMAFQMLFPGAPALYYGDEIGMKGENDPKCRAGMAWHNQDKELLDWQKYLTSLRKQHAVLRYGTYSVLLANEHIFAFSRDSQAERLIAIFNSSDKTQNVYLTDLEGSVDVPPQSVKIINLS